jgi:hypothetical protein
MAASNSRVATHNNIIIGGFDRNTVVRRVQTLRGHLNNLGARSNVEKIGDFTFPDSYKRKRSSESIPPPSPAAKTQTASSVTSRMNPEVRLTCIYHAHVCV